MKTQVETQTKPQPPSGQWKYKLWDLLKGITLFTLGIVIIFNPISGLKSIIQIVGFLLLTINVIEIIIALKKNRKGIVIAAFFEGILGAFLIFNALLPLRLLSLFLGFILLVTGVVTLVIRNFRSATKVSEHDSPHILRKILLQMSAPIVCIAAGLVLILFQGISIIILSYMLAASLLFLGINKVAMTLY